MRDKSLDSGLGFGIAGYKLLDFHAAGAQVLEVRPVRFVEFGMKFDILGVAGQDGEHQVLARLGIFRKVRLRQEWPGSRGMLKFRVFELGEVDFRCGYGGEPIHHENDKSRTLLVNDHSAIQQGSELHDDDAGHVEFQSPFAGPEEDQGKQWTQYQIHANQDLQDSPAAVHFEVGARVLDQNHDA